MKKPTHACPVHADQEHGREAKELRAGIEAIIDGGHWHVEDLRSALIDLTNAVDARDSLAFVERQKKRKKPTPKKKERT